MSIRWITVAASAAALVVAALPAVTSAASAAADCAPVATALGAGEVYAMAPDATAVGVVGIETARGNKQKAAEWRAGQSAPTFVPPPGVTGTNALAINASGVVAGITDLGSFRYHPSTGVTDTALAISVTGINAAGTAVGARIDGDHYVPIAWAADGTVRELASPAGYDNVVANDINDAGTIVGAGYFGSHSDALLWDPTGAVHVLPAPGSLTAAVGINNAGQIAGNSFDTGQKGGAFGVYWSSPGVVGRRLPKPTGLYWTQAADIDQAGNVVGSGFVLGQPDVPVYWNAATQRKAVPQGHVLPPLIDPSSGQPRPTFLTAVAGSSAAGFAQPTHGFAKFTAVRYECADQPAS